MSSQTLPPGSVPSKGTVPDAAGRFGEYGRRFVPETLMHALEELTAEYAKAQADPSFQTEFDGLLRDYVGRPSPLYFAERLTQHAGGARVYLKREDLNHTGAHKINNSDRPGVDRPSAWARRRVHRRDGRGATRCRHRHGLRPLTGLECTVYMGSKRTSAGRS